MRALIRLQGKISLIIKILSKMKYLINAKNVLRLSFVFVAFNLLFLSCNSQIHLNGTIPALEKMEQEPRNHYKELGNLSPEIEPVNDSLDAIAFPSKAHALTIKIISPAYLERAEIGAIMKRLQPPANSSKQTRAELDFLLELEKNRTEEQVNDALRMHEIIYIPLPGMKSEKHLFFEAYEIFGTQFNPKEYPKTKKLLNNIMKEMRIAEFTAKNHFLRARPRQLEANLQPLKKMSSSSFASGHTLWAYMQAYLMGALVPEKRSEFLDLAYKIGFSREVLGVHYPSDEEASRKLAHQLLLKMWEKPEFINDFKYAQLEWEELE